MKCLREFVAGPPRPAPVISKITTNLPPVGRRPEWRQRRRGHSFSRDGVHLFQVNASHAHVLVADELGGYACREVHQDRMSPPIRRTPNDYIFEQTFANSAANYFVDPIKRSCLPAGPYPARGGHAARRLRSDSLFEMQNGTFGALTASAMSGGDDR